MLLVEQVPHYGTNDAGAIKERGLISGRLERVAPVVPVGGRTDWQQSDD